jgi:hypothetical protein
MLDIRSHQRQAAAWLRRDPWLCAGLLGLALLLGLLARFGTDAGITYDEQRQVEYGERILAWFSSGFQDRRALTYKNLYLYGGLFDAPAQWLCRHSPLGVYDTRHLLTGFIALLGLVACWKIAALFGGSFAGFCAAWLLLLTPAWTGHGLFNPKDIPFGTAATFAVLACLRILLAPEALSRANAWRAGLAIGCALGIRPGGLFLLGYFGAAVALRSTFEIHQRRRDGQTAGLRRALLQTTWRTLAACSLAWVLMLIAWPWAQLSAVLRPLRAAGAAEHFAFAGSVLFDGRLISARALPVSYLPVWFAITLPETYGVALLGGLCALGVRGRAGLNRQGRLIAPALALCFASVAPLVALIATHAVLYDAQRHVLFVLPLMAAGAGVAIAACLGRAARRRWLQVSLALALLLLSARVGRAMLRLHPYEYVYFNDSFGGLPAAAGRFETDYWGASYAEALHWLVENVHPSAGARPTVAWCTDWIPLSYYVRHWPDLARFQLSNGARHRDYFLASARSSCHPPAGRILYRVTREGVALAYVIAVAPVGPPP